MSFCTLDRAVVLGLEWAFQVDMLVLLLVFAAGFHVYPLGFKHAGGLVYFNPPSSLTMKRFRSLSPCLRNGRLRRRQPPHGGGGGGVGAAQEKEEIVLLNNAVFLLDAAILDRITPCLATSPSCQDNGIACCSRATFVAWRRMFFPLSVDFLLLQYLRAQCARIARRQSKCQGLGVSQPATPVIQPGQSPVSMNQ